MKKNSLILIFLFLSTISSNAQDLLLDSSNLKSLFILCPDSLLGKRMKIFSQDNKILFWELYKKGNYTKIKSNFEDKIHGTFDIMIRDTIIDLDALINLQDNLIRLMYKNSDAVPTYEFKVFKDVNLIIIGVNLKSSDMSSTFTDGIAFFELKNSIFLDISSKILHSFNYYTDNYSDATVDSLSRFYSCDLRTSPKNNKLLYRFTESDTVIITYDFFDYYYFHDEKLDLHKEKHNEEFYLKKYIMDNGKLRLAE